jgi:hypothetical protein
MAFLMTLAHSRLFNLYPETRSLWNIHVSVRVFEDRRIGQVIRRFGTDIIVDAETLL